MIDTATIHRFTMAEYMALEIDGRTELIEGVIYDVAARNDPHRMTVNRLAKHLQLALPHLQVQIQDAVAIPDWTGNSAPESDIALTTNDTNATAADVLALIEVSDTTLKHDRRKVQLYTAAGVDSLIVNVPARVVEEYRVHRPLMNVYREGETLVIAGVTVEVSSLFFPE